MNSVLISGASKGLGAAMLKAFTVNGWQAIGTSRHGGTLEELDVCDEDSVLALRNRINLVPDCLILNAGSGIAGPIEMTAASEAVRQIDTNLLGVDRMVRAFLPDMRKRRSGTIVIVGSIASRLPIPFQALYSASKAAIANYAAALSMEVAPFGLHVMLVEPGDHRTDFGAARRRSPSDNDPYEPSTTRAINSMAKSEESGNDPERFANLVVRACMSDKPPHRLTITTPTERMLLILSAILPRRMMLKATRRAFCQA
ncbi:Short-chain dehydrogenase [Pseudovibrio denitrificans]|uniref:Short-chain dehydrogenase n=1 Tax=Pseudovibrio denitrificans TaxID=258256 RepID=A0A1I7ATI8_9HYPH|nr:SDR family NAD(P)-dependent oxidoreductase [Pseudovibrio denitrificans]SFT78187.1 Short-chain dehydrogenase [Pseudovibrio denitrificans]